jgi:hypothetical protein
MQRMHMARSYRVVSPFVAIKSTEEGHQTITIPSGCEIQIRGEVQMSGLVDIELNGEIVAVFMRDIDARADALP